MLNGLLTHNHREVRNDQNQPFDEQTYLDVLAGCGYRNCYYGKWHAGPGTAYDHCCEGFSYPSYNNPYIQPEYKAYLERMGLPEPEIHIEHSFWPDRVLEGPGWKQDSPGCNEHASGIIQGSKEAHEALFLANSACEKLRQLAAAGRPWHLRVDFWGPHQPYFPTREYADAYPPEQIPEYGSFCDTLEDKPAVYRTEKNPRISRDDKLIQPSPLPWSIWQEVLSRCYGQITMMDEAAGRILDTLDELGLAENTLVIWTTDHGDAVACHGGHFDKMSYMPEEMLRVPMAVRLPGRIPAGQESDKLVSLMDVAPTILDAADTAFERVPDGVSLLPLCEGKDVAWREDLMFETYGHGEAHFGRGVVTGRHKYIWNNGQLEEFYDLEADPFEMRNLIDDPACRELLEDMQSRLAAWRDKTGDTMSPHSDR